jgi:transposase-like protein
MGRIDRVALRRFLREQPLEVPMSEPSSSRIQPMAKPPACPKCHTGAHVAIEVEEASRQMWTCAACGVRWEVRLTPRTER